MRDPTANLAHGRRYEKEEPSSPLAGTSAGTGAEMMLVGTPCALASCHRDDFLPLCCDRCHQAFCSQHAEARLHACPGIRGKSGDVEGFHVPVCPICLNAFPGWRRASDDSPRAQAEAQSETDQALAKHLSQCPAMVQLAHSQPGQHIDLTQFREMKAKTSSGQGTCRAHACHKTLITPIICPACREAFCPSHRMPDQHKCTAPSVPTTKPGKKPETSAVSPGLRRLTASVLPKAEPPRTGSKEARSISAHAWSFGDWRRKLSSLPVGKSEAEKRAEQERASQIRAMAARHTRGLLSAKEEVKFAELCAQNPDLAKRLKSK